MRSVEAVYQALLDSTEPQAVRHLSASTGLTLVQVANALYRLKDKGAAHIASGQRRAAQWAAIPGADISNKKGTHPKSLAALKAYAGEGARAQYGRRERVRAQRMDGTTLAAVWR